MNKDMIRRAVETMMNVFIKDRNVEVSFSHLGKGIDYTCAIQTTLYEFDEDNDGPKGPMYLTLNSGLLQDTDELCEALSRVMKKAQVYQLELAIQKE